MTMQFRDGFSDEPVLEGFTELDPRFAAPRRSSQIARGRRSRCGRSSLHRPRPTEERKQMSNEPLGAHQPLDPRTPKGTPAPKHDKDESSYGDWTRNVPGMPPRKRVND
jgi:hypothetical protein